MNIEKARILMSGGRLHGNPKMHRYGGYHYCAYCGSRNFDPTLEDGQKLIALLNAPLT